MFVKSKVPIAFLKYPFISDFLFVPEKNKVAFVCDSVCWWGFGRYRHFFSALLPGPSQLFSKQIVIVLLIVYTWLMSS